MPNYFIHEDTMLLIPINENKTRVLERNDSFVIKQNIMEIIDASCRYFGSSYQGRCIGAKSIIKMDYKLPIIIEEIHEIVMFPTCSPRQEDCHWVSLTNIKNFEKSGKKTIITFLNDSSYEIDISYGSFENQVFRSTMLVMNLKKRKKIG